MLTFLQRTLPRYCVVTQNTEMPTPTDTQETMAHCVGETLGMSVLTITPTKMSPSLPNIRTQTGKCCTSSTNKHPTTPDACFFLRLKHPHRIRHVSQEHPNMQHFDHDEMMTQEKCARHTAQHGKNQHTSMFSTTGQCPRSSMPTRPVHRRSCPQTTTLTVHGRHEHPSRRAPPSAPSCSWFGKREHTFLPWLVPFSTYSPRIACANGGKDMCFPAVEYTTKDDMTRTCPERGDKTLNTAATLEQSPVVH